MILFSLLFHLTYYLIQNFNKKKEQLHIYHTKIEDDED